MSDTILIFLFCGFFAIMLTIFCVFAVKFKLGKRKMKKLTNEQFVEKHSQNKKIFEAEQFLIKNSDEINSQTKDKNEQKG